MNNEHFPNAKTGDGVIQSVRRALEVLFCFTPDVQTLTAGEISSRLGLNRTTTWRYLQSLAVSGLIREVDAAGSYSLGPRTLQLAEAYTSLWGNLRSISNSALVDLRDATNETAALHVLQGWARVVVCQVESQEELHRTYRDIGEPLSLLVGAPSIAMLAWMSERERDAYLANSFVSDSERKRELEQELRRVRECGFAVSRRTRTSNIASVAAPVIVDRRVIASVNVSGPLERFAASNAEAIAKHVIRAATEIERKLNSLE